MRPVLLACMIFVGAVTLAALGLVPTSMRTRTAASSATVPNEPVPAKRSAKDNRNPVVAVVGAQKVSVEDAEYDALVQAQMELEKYLRSLDPPVYWKPRLDYIRNTLLKGNVPVVDVPLPEGTAREVLEDHQVTSLKRAVFDIEITPTVRRDLLYHARQDLSWDRLLAVSPILGGVVLLLIALSAYIHLDERTRGYYTGWLRLGAVGAAAAVIGSGWWWFTQ